MIEKKSCNMHTFSKFDLKFEFRADFQLTLKPEKLTPNPTVTAVQSTEKKQKATVFSSDRLPQVTTFLIFFKTKKNGSRRTASDEF